MSEASEEDDERQGELLYVRGIADLNVAAMKLLILPPLEWVHFEREPGKLLVSNTGQTVALDPKFVGDQLPHLVGGPIGQLSPQYQFVQINFTWGASALEGSQHTIDGGHRLPMEMHVVLKNESYATLELAAGDPGGVIELVYFFQIGSADNPTLEVLIEQFPRLQATGAWTYIDDAPSFLEKLIYKFTDDYYLYRSTRRTPVCQHSLLVLVTREISYISVAQLEAFRQLLGHEIDGNSRSVLQEDDDSAAKVHHVNPAAQYTNTTLRVGSIRVENHLMMMMVADANFSNYCNFSETFALKMSQRI